MRYLRSCIIAMCVLTSSVIAKQDYVVGTLQGQLGNQLFIIAATVSLALDNNAIPVFPALIQNPDYNLPFNYQKVFSHLNTQLPKRVKIKRYLEPQFDYTPIKYQPNMELFGWFQSEKYFAKHKNEIIELFSPPQEISTYLGNHYQHIIDHPKSVAIHARSYYREDPTGKCHITYEREYFEKAISVFPDDSLFVVFSNDINWCREMLSTIPRDIIFIENNASYHHDFYLMSLCKHNIICNSSFSWWAAYLNLNPEKIVVAPNLWFNPAYISSTKDLKPDGWITIY